MSTSYTFLEPKVLKICSFSSAVPPQKNTRYPKKDKPRTNLNKPPYFESPIRPCFRNPGIASQPGTRRLLSSASLGLQKGNNPIRHRTSGGNYYVRNGRGDKIVGIFKPADEEAKADNSAWGLKKGTKVGKAAMAEVAVSLLDHSRSGRWVDDDMKNGFSGVPLTVMVGCLNKAFNHPQGFNGGNSCKKVGSLQEYIQNSKSCAVVEDPCIFPVEEVHKIAVLDLRVGNADRHAGNILWIREGDGSYKLFPVDHGYCLLESIRIKHFEDFKYEWLEWPQARQRFSDATLRYIKSLDVEKDIELLKSIGFNSELSLRNLRILTSLLKDGAERGLSPYQIGSILCRDKYKESVIEKVIAKAHDMLFPGANEAWFLKCVSDLLRVELDKVAMRPLQLRDFITETES